LKTDADIFAHFKSDRALGNEAQDIRESKGGWKLYVIGYIGYADAITHAGGSVFYRDYIFEYDPRTRRFHENKNDQDYDYGG
jgi:hypothetical protein